LLSDLRPLLFGGLKTFDQLTASDPQLWPVWRITRCDEPAWWVGLLSAAAAFAEDHGLLSVYRAKLDAIPIAELRVAKGDAERRSSTFPVWEIVNELIVARLLERALGWTYSVHEPRGRGGHRGDWEFHLPTGGTVFVEVKSLSEPDRVSSGVYSRPSFAPRLRNVLKGAYVQLPDDGRATLVVIVGHDVMRIPFGVMHGDLFQSLYGQMQITFQVMPYDPTSVKLSPSFREMFIHGGKHRRLGCIAGLSYGGIDEPSIQLYAIQNPFSQESVGLQSSTLRNIDKFVVDSEGHGEVIDRKTCFTLWELIAPRTE
jgi:hypothetical protein